MLVACAVMRNISTDTWATSKKMSITPVYEFNDCEDISKDEIAVWYNDLTRAELNQR